jgi:hypothetical protein
MIEPRGLFVCIAEMNCKVLAISQSVASTGCFISPLTVYGEEVFMEICARTASKVQAIPTNDIPLEKIKGI